MNIFDKLNKALQNGLSKEVFDHIRNYLMCALLLSIGTTELREHSSTLFGFIPKSYSGAGIVGLSLLLIAFNLYDGIRKLSKSKYHVVLVILLIGIYLFLSIRVIEMAWNFRAV